MKLHHLKQSTALSEVKMSPSTIKNMVSNIPDVKVGIEYELVVKDFGDDGSSKSDMDSIPDYEQNEFIPTTSWNSLKRDITQFFADGEFNSQKEVTTALKKAEREYSKWKKTQWERFIEDNYEDWQIEKQDEEPEGDWDQPPDGKPYITEFEEDNYVLFEEQEGSIESWLSMEDMEMFDGFGDRFGLTWPHWEEEDNTEDAEPIGIGKRNCYDIADSFSSATGMPIKICKKYHGCGKRPANAYVMEPDSSITPDNDLDWGWEFVGPALPLADALDQIQKVKKWANAGNAYTNESCGLHMNISLPNYNMEKLDFIKLALFLGDEWVSQQFSRLGNKYARSSIDTIKNNIEIKPEALDSAMEQMRKGLNTVASKLIHGGHVDKMTSINTKDDRIEFRSPGNNWLDMDIDMVMTTMMRMVVAMDIALDPEKEKREYAIKLYKVLTGGQRDERMQLFSMYNAGTITRADFMRRWSQLLLSKEKADSSSKAANLALDITKKLKVFKIISTNDKDISFGMVDAFDANSAREIVRKNLKQYELEPDDQWDVKELPYNRSLNQYQIIDIDDDKVLHTFTADDASSALKYARNYAYNNNISFGKWILQRPHNRSVD